MRAGYTVEPARIYSAVWAGMYSVACARCRAPQSPDITEFQRLVRSRAPRSGRRSAGPLLP